MDSYVLEISNQIPEVKWRRKELSFYNFQAQADSNLLILNKLYHIDIKQTPMYWSKADFKVFTTAKDLQTILWQLKFWMCLLKFLLQKHCKMNKNVVGKTL